MRTPKCKQPARKRAAERGALFILYFAIAFAVAFASIFSTSIVAILIVAFVSISFFALTLDPVYGYEFILSIILGGIFGLIIFGIISIAIHTGASVSSNPVVPYLNTSHYPVFTPFIQNTSIWLSINGSVYQYWASLNNYKIGADPCVLTMSAVENGTITHTLNKTEANATLASAQLTELSLGNFSPNQSEYANPTVSYFHGLLICQNYGITK